MKKTWLMTIALLSIALPIKATETRCGWFKNPTPANYYLEDNEAHWIIALQGGYRAQGMENMPSIYQNEYININRGYGMGCACLEVETDGSENKILTVQGGESLPLSTCRNDPNLRQY